MKGTKFFAFAVCFGFLSLVFRAGLAQAQAPDPDILAQLKAAIEADEVIKIDTVVQKAADLVFIGPIEDNVARGVVSVSAPMPNVTHMVLRVVQPGGAVAHTSTVQGAQHWGGVFRQHKFGVELHNIGIQDGAILTVDLYRGGKVVAHAEGQLPKQVTRPNYIVENFVVQVEEEWVNLEYDFSSTSLQPVTVVPQVTIANQNIVADKVLLQKYLPAVVVGPKTVKSLQHQVALPEDPGVYEVVIWLFSEEKELLTGALRQNFVVEDGGYGVFESVELYQDEDLGTSRLIVRGGAKGVGETISLAVLAEPEVNGSVGESLIDARFDVPLSAAQRFKKDVDIDLASLVSGRLKGQVQMLSGERVIAETSFDFLVGGDLPPESVEPVGDAEVPLIESPEVLDEGEIKRWIKFGLGGLLLLLLLWGLWRWKRKRSKLLMGLGLLLMGGTAWAQSATLVNTWYYPMENWIYNPVATTDYDNFRYVRFEGNVFNPLSQEGFFQFDPDAILVRFVSGADDLYSQVFTYTVSGTKKYQFDIPVPTSLAEGRWEIELYFQYQGSFYQSTWEDDVTTLPYTIEIDKTPPTLQPFTYDGTTYAPSNKLVWPGVETFEDDETLLLQQRKIHFLDQKQNELVRKTKRKQRHDKINQYNHLISKLQEEEYAELNGDVAADPVALADQISLLAIDINNLTKDLGEIVPSNILFSTGVVNTPIANTVTGGVVLLGNVVNCQQDAANVGQTAPTGTSTDACIQHHQTQIATLNPQIVAKRVQIRAAKSRFKNAAIGVQFICEDTGAGCNPSCNVADEQCDIDCTLYPQTCDAYQVANPAGHAANCAGSPLNCAVDCLVDGDVCRMRGLVADVRGNFCDDDTYCDDGATRRFQACDNVGNCLDLSAEAVETDWYDPVQPDLGGLKITRNKNNVDGVETIMPLDTTSGVGLVTCNTLPSGFAGGSGTLGDPYQICDVNQLQNINSGLSQHYVLLNNIDASATSGWNGGAGFLPIGASWPRFAGSLDGNGYVIKDLFINRPGSNSVGLFAMIRGGDVINLGLVDVDITGQNYVGGLAGYLVPFSPAAGNPIEIEQIYVKGSVNGQGRVGGVVGYARGHATLQEVYFDGSVVASSDLVGGLIGQFLDAEDGGPLQPIERVYTTGTVEGRYHVGGIIGMLQRYTSGGNANRTYITDAYSDMTVRARGNQYAGGIVGGGMWGHGLANKNIENTLFLGEILAVRFSGIMLSYPRIYLDNSYYVQTATQNNNFTIDGSVGGAAARNSFAVSDLLLKAAIPSADTTQPYHGWSNTVWDFGTVNDYPTLRNMPDFNEDIARVSGVLAAADRFSFEIAGADVENPDSSSHPKLFDTHACGSSSVDGFFLAAADDSACSQRYTACALSSNLRGVQDNLLGTACSVACPTVTYDIAGQLITETYQRQGDLCVPRCDYRLFDGCFPFLLIGETCQNVGWTPLETAIDEGVVFTQTSNCGDTRQWVGTKPITQSIKHFLDGEDVFGVYFYDTLNDGPGFTDIAFRGKLNFDTDGFTQANSGTVVADWKHEVGYSPEGGKILRIDSTSLSAGYAAWERTGITVSPSTDYVLTYWVKTDAVTNRNGVGAWPVIYENGTNDISAQYATTMTAAPDTLDWEKIEIPFTTGAGVTSIDLQLRLEAQDGREAHFDDVVILEENWRFDATKSWYTEAKGDAGDGICDYITGDSDGDPRGGNDVRCGRDYFPEKAVIALTNNGMWLLDAIDGVMWMSSLVDSGGGYGFVFSTIRQGTPFASNAKLFSAFQFDIAFNGAMAIADFISEDMYTHRMSDCFLLAGQKGSGTSVNWAEDCDGDNTGVLNGFSADILSGRNIPRNPWTMVMPQNESLANHQINHMHSNIIGGQEYIVVAHDYAGITILNKTNSTVQYLEFDGSSHAGRSWNYSPASAHDYRAVYLANDGKLYYLWDWNGDSRTRLHVIDDVTSLPFDGSVLSGNASWDHRIQPNNASTSYPTTALGDEADALHVKDDRVLIGADAGFDLYKGSIDGGSQHQDLSKQRVSLSYASAPLFRDVWGHWVTSSQDVSGKANDLTDVGGVNLSVVGVGSDLQQFNFDNNAYLQSDIGAFSAIGNTLTIGTWVYTDAVPEDGGYLIAQRDTVDTEFALYRTAENKLRVEGATSHTIDAYTLSGWNFVVATFDGTTKRAYIDGIKVLEVPDTVGSAVGAPSLDPSNISYLDQYDDASGSDSIQNTTSVEIVGNLAYVTARNGDALQIFDISDPANISYLGGYRNTTLMDRAYDVAVSGNYAYVANRRRDSLAVIDVSNPASPSFVTELQGSIFDGATSVAISGNYAYVATADNDGFVVVDISNPAAPVQVSNNGGGDMVGPEDIQIVGNYAYTAAAGANSLIITDVSDPLNPVYVGRYRNSTLLEQPMAVEVRGNYAYVACEYRNSMTVIDISNPASPVWVAEVQNNSNLSGARGIAVEGDYAYVAAFNDDSVQVINIANPTTPVWAGEYVSSNLNGAIDVEVVGDKIFMANYHDDSLVTLDIGYTVGGLRLKLGAGADGGVTTSRLNGALALPFIAQEAYSDVNVEEVYHGTRDWFDEDTLITLQGTSDEVVDLRFGDFGSYFIATNGGGITHFDYSGRVLRTISDAPTSETNVSIVSNNINVIDYRNGWLIIGYQGRGVEIVNIAPEITEMLSKYDEAEFDPYFFY